MSESTLRGSMPSDIQVLRGTIRESNPTIRGAVLNPEQVRGESGITPLFKVDNVDELFVSYDKGNTWQFLASISAGINGKDGVGIHDIQKIESNGLVDTYYIILTNGNTEQFTVTNGKDGEKGEQGIQGPQGEQGITPIFDGEDDELRVSYDGGHSWQILQALPRGEKGEQGIQGAQGPQGIQGPQGVKGEQGAQGEKGENGKDFRISKTYASVAAMNAGYATDGVEIGGFVLISTGDVNDADNAKLYVKGDSSYLYLTDLSGAQGIRGEKGEQGIQGVQGPQGEQGIQGIQGIQGERGERGTGIASVEQSSQYKGADGRIWNWYNFILENGETIEDAFYSRDGLDGEQGPQGPQGLQGEQGERGLQGPMGESSNWYSGTAIDGQEEIAVFENSGIATARINDMYLNTKTGRIYQCVKGGAAVVAQWSFKIRIKYDLATQFDSSQIGMAADAAAVGDALREKASRDDVNDWVYQLKYNTIQPIESAEEMDYIFEETQEKGTYLNKCFMYVGENTTTANRTYKRGAVYKLTEEVID